jgi:hypothetical protein
MTRFLISVLAGVAALTVPACTLAEGIPFDDPRWDLSQAVVTQHLGRTALAGFALLGEVEFEDGVIEVDVAVDGRTSYPGFVFRYESPGNYERYYLRPHRACGRYPDVHQYTPVINGIAGWQLYSGDGFTSFGEVPSNEWVHLRLEVEGTQARVFFGDMEHPVLVVPQLQRGRSRGAIGLEGPRDGTAFFSDFSWSGDEALAFDPPPPSFPRPGILDGWEVSAPMPWSAVDIERHPDGQEIGEIAWQPAAPASSGLVDIARLHGRTGREPDVVFARTSIDSDEARTMQLKLGYSDLVGVFLNGELLFIGNSAYRSRDPSFAGIIGLNDIVVLPLRRGRNELLLTLAESFGGWGFIAQDGEFVYAADGVGSAWETEPLFRVPETALFDRDRGVVYVSEFDQFAFAPGAGRQSIARVSADGKTVERRWATGLSNPSGLALGGGRLWAIERKALVEIDPGTGEVAARHPLLTAGFLNDIAIGPDGAVYLSDSRNNAIYLYRDGAFDLWLSGDPIAQPNGLCVSGGSLAIGNTGTGSVLLAGLDDRTVTVLARLGSGTIDGIEATPSGDLLVSHWEGRLLRIDRSGGVTRLLDTTAPGYNIANFGYDAGSGTVFIPTFTDNRLIAYRIGSR